MNSISYEILAKYKYRLREPYYFATGIKLAYRLVSEYITLEKDGVLDIRAGYAWDGASGPALDTVTIVRGSLVHDALYQLISLTLLPVSYRKCADKLLRRICKEDGMGFIRRQYVYWAVRIFGGLHLRLS